MALRDRAAPNDTLSTRAPASRLLLLALLLAPAARADGGPPGGRFELRLAVGGGNREAPAVLVGAGLALLDDGATRLDVQGHLAFSGGYDLAFQEVGVAGGTGHLQTFGVIAETTAARRLGRFEPWAGVGLSVMNAGGEFQYECYTSTAPGCAGLTAQSTADSFEGSWVAAPTATAGLRFALTADLLLEGSLRWISERRSAFEELPVSAKVGGLSGLLSIVWRAREKAVPAAQSVKPTAPAPPPGPPPVAAPEPPLATPAIVGQADAACPAGQVPSFAVHEARRFRCYADPVRGGWFCEPGGVEGRFVERALCEDACRSGESACRAGPIGAACARCVAGCAATRSLPCEAILEGRTSCRLAAGAFGLREDRLVPTTCAPER